MSQLQTSTVVESISKASSSFRYEANSGRVMRTSTTENVSAPAKENFLVPTKQHGTSGSFTGTKLHRFVSVKPGQVEARAERIEAVNGAVLKFDDMSVLCEMNVQGNAMKVQLPRELFPQTISHGLPISLKLIEKNGFRMPKISLRPLSKSREQIDLEARMNALIDEL